jgi:hypothetical protein
MTVLQSVCSASLADGHRCHTWSGVSVRTHHAGWLRERCAHPMVGNDHESPNVGVCPTPSGNTCANLHLRLGCMIVGLLGYRRRAVRPIGFGS